MQKRASADISKEKANRPVTSSEEPRAPAVDLDALRLKPSRRPLYIGLVLLALLAGVLVLAFVYDRGRRPTDAEGDLREDVRLGEEFKALKNAGGAADDLLAPPPDLPEGPLSKAEADRIQAECFLRQDIRIVAVRPAPAGRFVLSTRGNVSAPTLQVRTPAGVDRIQRTMSNPDLVVEVRDGKIHGVRAEMP